MAEPTRPSTDIDKPATSYDDFTPTFIMKTDNIANLRLGPQFYKCNITIQDPEMAEDDNQREITLSSHDSIHEIAEAGRLLQSVIQRTVGAEARSSRIFIRAIQCIDLTGGQDSDADSKLDYPPTQEPIYNPVTEPEAPKNTNDAGVETIPNSPVPPSFQQAMSNEGDMAGQPVLSRAISSGPILRKRKRSDRRSYSEPRRSARLSA